MIQTTPKIKVIIADNQQVYLDGLKLSLEQDPTIEVVAAATHAKLFVHYVTQYQPDVAITDMNMPDYDGVWAIEQIRVAVPHVKCIALSNYDLESYITGTIAAGAKGYVAKNATTTEIIQAIKTVYVNKSYYCSISHPRVIQLINRSRKKTIKKKTEPNFSDREIEVIRLICQGQTSEEIGKTLFLSPHTVNWHRRQIFAKMDTHKLTDLVVYAIRKGIFLLDEE
ncbi:response regulator transcription factor [Foetidibacter luteolus]|uniref:response regulator transcription factor n=1 Tax=Foetidibacter luteolus TaxID=2608880 RepID=UPI00129A68AF|nr:response regulator transcription factor [Foetidibacter luteolus]